MLNFCDERGRVLLLLYISGFLTKLDDPLRLQVLDGLKEAEAEEEDEIPDSATEEEQNEVDHFNMMWEENRQ